MADRVPCGTAAQRTLHCRFSVSEYELPAVVRKNDLPEENLLISLGPELAVYQIGEFASIMANGSFQSAPFSVWMCSAVSDNPESLK